MTFRFAAPVLLAAAGALAACGPLPPRKAPPTPPARDEQPPARGPSRAPESQAPGSPSLPPLPPLRDYSQSDLSRFPRTAEQVSGPAVVQLLGNARDALATGNTEQAVAQLETALDIEPRNPFVWQKLADAHLRQYRPDQAEQKAQRSNSFAHGNPYIELENWRLIAESRSARGDVLGAQQAQDRVDQLQAQLGD